MSDQIFAGRTALVTGGGRGIGRAICRMLAAQGARVAVNFQRHSVAAEETVRLIEADAERVIAVQADVSNEDDVRRMIDTVRSELGPIDLLVNNAGIAESKPHSAVSFSRWREMFAVNVDGPFLTTWAVKDEMLSRGFGRIVNVSSLAAKILKPDMIDYATTKAAVIAFTRHCAAALAPHVRVNCVAPGLTNTDLALLTKQAVIWEQISAWLVPVYYVAVLLALWGTIASVPEAVARVTYDLLTAVRPETNQIPFRKVLTILVGWFFVSSQFWNWGGFRFDLLTQIGALVTVNLGVGIVCLLSTYYNATLPPLYRTHWWVTLGGVLSGIVLLIAFVATAIGMIMKLR